MLSKYADTTQGAGYVSSVIGASNVTQQWQQGSPSCTLHKCAQSAVQTLTLLSPVCRVDTTQGAGYVSGVIGASNVTQQWQCQPGSPSCTLAQVDTCSAALLRSSLQCPSATCNATQVRVLLAASKQTAAWSSPAGHQRQLSSQLAIAWPASGDTDQQQRLTCKPDTCHASKHTSLLASFASSRFVCRQMWEATSSQSMPTAMCQVGTQHSCDSHAAAVCVSLSLYAAVSASCAAYKRRFSLHVLSEATLSDSSADRITDAAGHPINTTAQCCAACQQRSGCNVWTFCPYLQGCDSGCQSYTSTCVPL